MSHRSNPSFLFVPALATAIAVGACSGVNRPPDVVNQQVTTDEDVPIEIRILDGASDPDGDTLTVTHATAEGHHVEIKNGSVVLTPAQDFHGTIAVSYSLNDGRNPDVTGHVAVTVRPVNDTPVATGGARNIHGSDPVMLEGSDVDGDALSYEVLAGPAHGTITGNPPALQYTPQAAFIGDDAITYRVSDGTAASEPATLQLHVSPGAAPVAIGGAVSGNEDQQLELSLGATDPDGDAVAFTIVTPPIHGTLDGTPPNLVYTPGPDFHGDDALVFSVSDGFLSSDIATVAIHVAPANDVPVATPQAVAATEDTSTEITLVGSDIDGDALTFRVKDAPMHGTLSSSSSGALTYTPALNYHGPDSFTFIASDGQLSSSPAMVAIHVASLDDPPVAMSFTHMLAEDTSNSITLVGSDAEGASLSFAIATPPAHGVLSGTPPDLTYTPAANYNGPDSFTYTVSDGTTTSEPGTVTLQVTPVNDRPVASDSTVTTSEDTSVDFTLQASDVDGPTLTFTILTRPSDGTLTGGASQRYTPAANANGTRSLTFRVSDGTFTADATVTIVITPANDPPFARTDFAGTDPDTPLTFSVTRNDLDIDGDTLTLDAVDPPANGTAAIVGGQLVYTPDAGFTGIDEFRYTVGDGHGGSASGLVHLGVGGFPPGAPTETIATVGGTISTTEDRRIPAVSSDGRYIAFASPLALVSDDTNNVSDIYLYDRSTGALTRVSVATSGLAGNGESLRPHLSGDGRFTVFESIASNLVPGDSNGRLDVFRHDRVTGETVRVSVASDGSQTNGDSLDADVSGDGNLIVFTSRAFNLTPGDANGASDVFVRDVAAGTTQRISVSTLGRDTDLASSEPVMSGDGRFVAFASSATNLVAGDTNEVEDVFVRDRVAGATTRASVSTNGGEANGPSFEPSLSRDGQFVSFRSFANNLIPDDFGSLYVRDVVAQTTTQPPLFSGTTSTQLSGDGRYLVTYDFSRVEIIDRFATRVAAPTGSTSWRWPVISDNGRYVVVLDTKNGGGVTVAPNPL